MNPRRVIIWMTVGVFIILSLVMVLAVGGLPPWPVLLWFALSHAFFCIVIMGVNPYRGPYVEPMKDPELKD